MEPEIDLTQKSGGLKKFNQESGMWNKTSNSLNLFFGSQSLSLPANFPTHPESILFWEWLFSHRKQNFLLLWFMENFLIFLSAGHLDWKKKKH